MTIFSFISPKKPKEAAAVPAKTPSQRMGRIDSVREPQTPSPAQYSAHASPVRGSPHDTEDKIEATRSKIVEVKRKLSKRNLRAPATGAQPSNAAYRLEPPAMPSPLVVKEPSPSPNDRPGIKRQPTVPFYHDGQIKTSSEAFTPPSSRPSTPPSPSPAPRQRQAPYPTGRTVSSNAATTPASSMPSRLRTLRRTVSQRFPKLQRTMSKGQTSQPPSPAVGKEGISLPYNSGRCWDASCNVPAWRYESMSNDKKPPLLM